MRTEGRRRRRSEIKRDGSTARAHSANARRRKGFTEPKGVQHRCSQSNGCSQGKDGVQDSNASSKQSVKGLHNLWLVRTHVPSIAMVVCLRWLHYAEASKLMSVWWEKWNYVYLASTNELNNNQRKHVGLHESVSKSSKTNDKNWGILMSQHVRQDSEFWWNEWLVVEIGRRTENEEETDKKYERNQKVKMCLGGTSFWILPLNISIVKLSIA